MGRKNKKQRNLTSYSTAAKLFALAAFLMLVCSCVSFNIGDWPSEYVYPHNSPSENLCGATGAFCAYYLLYYIGPGIFVLLISTIALLIINLWGRKLHQPIIRSIGLVLLSVAASATFYCIAPHSIFSFPIGSGGIIGIAAAHFLKHYFAVLGMVILLVCTWVVGLVLFADSLLLAFLRTSAVGIGKITRVFAPVYSSAKVHSQVLGEIWQKLNLRQQESTHRHIQISEAGREEQAKINVDRPVELIGEESQETGGGIEQAAEKRADNSYIPKSYENYSLPPLELLAEPEYRYSSVQSKVVKEKAASLEKLLSEFSVHAEVVAADTGPVVTMFELQLAAGIKVSKISALSNDMARALGAAAVRVVAPLPGKHTIGIEVPNSEKEKVRMKDIIQSAKDSTQMMNVPLFLGKDSSGEPLICDLTTMPHLLIAGTTGSGKSVCINSVITGIMLNRRPDEVKLILIDPKMVEMTAFNNLPHLMAPIITETKRAVQVLEWATVKMDERYALLAEARVKNIAGYNRLGPDGIRRRFTPTSEAEEAQIPKKLPHIVIVIDELADLMMIAGKEIENYIVRLAQKSRAIGIHIILATQRPQATVVTGLIKSNMPCRIGFRVAARMDSRIILDQNGAETLLGQGDMLFLKPGTSDLIRAQGTFVDETEIRRIAKFLKEVAEPQYHPELMQLSRVNTADFEKDELFDDAVQIVLETKRGSVSLLQRRLSVGYARASRIIEMMAASGILGEYKGSQAREVLLSADEYEKIKQQMQREKEQGYKDMNESDHSQDSSCPCEGQKGYVSSVEDR